MRIFCSICKEIFIPYSEVLVTNCGHLYHGSCISTWTERHKTCPQCRTNLKQPFRVFFDVDKDNDADPSTLEHELEVVSDKLREAERDKKNLIEENRSFERIVEGMKECAISLSKKNDLLKTSVKALKKQVTNLTEKNEAVTHLENEVLTLKAKVSTFEKIELMLKGTADEVNSMIETTPVTELAVKQLCTYVGVLKLQLQKLEIKNLKLTKENLDFVKKARDEKLKYAFDAGETIKNLKESNNALENELYCLRMLHKEYKRKHPEKNEEITSPCKNVSNITQVKIPIKKTSFDIDFSDDEENQSVHLKESIEKDKVINNWEELICAGPSRNRGITLKKSRSFSKPLHSHKDNDVSRSNEAYAFDGLGGRKKLRLGGPTPLEEFEKIKKKKDLKHGPSFQHKKIIEYYQLKQENSKNSF